MSNMSQKGLVNSGKACYYSGHRGLSTVIYPHAWCGKSEPNLWKNTSENKCDKHVIKL